MLSLSKAKYAVIAIVLIVIVILGVLILRGRQRREEVQYQIDEASTLVNNVNRETEQISNSWEKIDSTLKTLKIKDVSDDTSSLQRAIEDSKEARNDIAEMREELNSIRQRHSNIQASLQELGRMEIPDWIRDYINLKSSMIEKDGERADVTETLLNDIDQYYQFSEQFFAGMIAQIEMEENSEEGINIFPNED